MAQTLQGVCPQQKTSVVRNCLQKVKTLRCNVGMSAQISFQSHPRNILFNSILLEFILVDMM